MRSLIKDNISVPWAIKNSQNACQTMGGATFDPRKILTKQQNQCFLQRVFRPGCLVATNKGETSTYAVAAKKAIKENCGPLKIAHFRPSP